MHVSITRRAALGAIASISAAGAAGAAVAASPVPEAVDTRPSLPAATPATGWAGDGVYQLDYPRTPKLFIVRLDYRPFSSMPWLALADTLDPEDVTHFMPMPAFHHRNPVKVGEIGRLVDERADPLAAAIDTFRRAVDRYNDTLADDDAGADDLAAATFDPPLNVLLQWHDAATSRAGAMAALRVVQDLPWLPGRPKLGEAMNLAALRYLARYDLATEAHS